MAEYREVYGLLKHRVVLCFTGVTVDAASGPASGRRGVADRAVSGEYQTSVSGLV